MVNYHHRKFLPLIIIAISFPFLFSSPVKAQTGPVTEAQLAAVSLRLLQMNADGRPNTSAKIEELTRLARERKDLMLRAIREKPDLVLRQVFKQSVVASFPSAAQALLEKEISASGELETVWVEKTDSLIAKHYLRTVDRGTLELFAPDNSSLLDAGQTSVSGFLLDNLLLLSETSNKSLVAAKAMAKSTVSTPLRGTKKLAVILFNFQNDQQGANQPFSVDSVRRSIFTDSNSVAAYYRENSFNQLNLTGDVFGWYVINRNRLISDCNAEEMFSPADSLEIRISVINQAKANGFQPSDYQYFMLIAPTFCGPSTLGFFVRDTNTVFLNGVADVGTSAHELGHILGLSHAQGEICHNVRTYQAVSVDAADASCEARNYGDPFSVMNNRPNRDRGLIRQLNNFHKAILGWFDPNSTRTITESGIYDLAPAETPSGNAIIRIPIKDSVYSGSFDSGSSLYYYLEYRQPNGIFDNFSASDPAVKGVSVRLAGNYQATETYTYLLDATPVETSGNLTDASILPGQTFEDARRGIKIKVLSADNANAKLEITVDEQRYLKVAYPNEDLAISKAHKVTVSWQRNNLPDNLSATLSLKNANGSVPWTMATLNDGKELVDWNQVPIGRYKFIATVNYENSVYRDESDVFFSLQNAVPTLILDRPEIGAIFPTGGQPLRVTWSSQDIPRGIRLTVSLLNERNQIIQTEPVLVTDAYKLMGLPTTVLPGRYKIKISATVSGQSITDINSDYFFLISPTELKVVTPNGGERIPKSVPYRVKWTTNNIPSVQSIKLRLIYLKPGVGYQAFPPRELTNTGLTDFDFSAFPTGQYRIELSTVVNGETLLDQSDNLFTLTGSNPSPLPSPPPPVNSGDTTLPIINLVTPTLGPTIANRSTTIEIQAYDNIPRNVRTTSIGVKPPGLASPLLEVCDNTKFQFLPAVATCTLTVLANQWVTGTIIVVTATDNSSNRNTTIDAYIVRSGQLQGN